MENWITEFHEPVASLFFEANKACEKHGFPLLKGNGYLTKSLLKVCPNRRLPEKEHFEVAEDRTVRTSDAIPTATAPAAGSHEEHHFFAGPPIQTEMSRMNDPALNAMIRTNETFGLSTTRKELHAPAPVAVTPLPSDGRDRMGGPHQEVDAHCAWSQSIAAPLTPITLADVGESSRFGLGNVDSAMATQDYQYQWWTQKSLDEQQDSTISSEAFREHPNEADLAAEDWNEAIQHTLVQFQCGAIDEWERATHDALTQFANSPLET